MKKHLNRWILAVLMTLTGLILGGCEKVTKDETSQWSFPDALKDCQVFWMRSDGGSGMTVMRCPNSVTSTNYRSGKTTRTAVVIDGITYVPATTSGPQP